MLELWSYPPDASHVQGLTKQLMVINTKAHMCQLMRIEVDNKSDKTTKKQKRQNGTPLPGSNLIDSRSTFKSGQTSLINSCWFLSKPVQIE